MAQTRESAHMLTAHGEKPKVREELNVLASHGEPSFMALTRRVSSRTTKQRASACCNCIFAKFPGRICSARKPREKSDTELK